MKDVYKSIEEYNPGKKTKVLIMFDDMIGDMISNKKLYEVVSELSIRGWKLNISLLVMTQSYFPLPEYVRLNTINLFIIKIQNRQEFQKIPINNLSVTGFNQNKDGHFWGCSRKGGGGAQKGPLP